MPVVWIDDESISLNCGNCEGVLNPTTTRKAFIYDAASEVPREVKTGQVNLSVCPHCQYHAWLWPGFLVVDRGRRRAVFCYFGRSDAESKLTECWVAVEPVLSEDEIENIRKRTIWLHSYSHIYEVLCESERSFSLEAASGDKYRQRLKISDLRQRAEQWLRDAEDVGGIMIKLEEASPQFLTILQEVIRENLDNFDDVSRKAFQTALLHIDSLIQAAPIVVENRTPSIENPEWVLAPDDPLRDSLITFNRTRSEAVTHALNELVRRTPRPDELRNARVDEALRSYVDAQQYLFGADPDTSLIEPLDQLKRDTPDIMIREPDKDISVAHYVSQLDEPDNPHLAMLGEIAVRNRESNVLFGAGLARYLSRLWRNEQSPYARFLANVLCSNFFSIHGMSDHGVAALADACLSFDSDQPLKIILPENTMRMYAICWQRIGRYFSHSGDGPIATMCSAIAGKFFKFAGDMAGEIRSRLDIVTAKINLRGRISSSEVEALLVDIERYAASDGTPESQEQIRDEHLECLLQLALAQRAEYVGRPEILALSMDYKLESKEGGAKATKVTPAFNPPIFGFPDSDNPEQPKEGEGIVPDSPPLPESEPEPESSPYGRVMLIEVSFNEESRYVAGVLASSIEWIRTFRRALKVAAEYKHERWWYGSYYHLIEQCRAIHAGISIYFFRLMLAEAEAAGFDKMPDDLLSPLKLTLAQCYLTQVRDSGSAYLHDPEFSNLLDDIESGMFDRILGQQKPKIQSLTGEEETVLDEGTESSLVVSPDALIILAELLEAGGRFAAAGERCQAYVSYCEQELQDTIDPQIKRVFLNGRVAGLYRRARSLLKHYRQTNSYESLVMALNAIEAYKARSILSDSDATLTKDDQGRRVLTRFRSIKIGDLKDQFPDNCYLMVFALMQATDINSGFWFSALISAHDERILFPRFIEFDDVFNPVEAVSAAFNDARQNLYGVSFSQIPEATRPFDDQICVALEQLGAVLFSEEVVEYLQQSDAQRLIIVPESYLFDVPFPALRVRVGDKSKYLFELNQKGGPAISVSPNLTHFQKYEAKSLSIFSGEQLSSLATTLSLSPRWRSDLVPIYGVSKRLKQMFAVDLENDEHNLALDIGKESVQSFLDSLAKSRVALFFGHGEITEAEGSVLIADDGFVSEHEINAYSRTIRFKAQLLILCACSGINSSVTLERIHKDISGVHVSLLKGGVRCVVGSLFPTFPICGLILLEELLLKSNLQRSTCDEKLLSVYRTFVSHSELSSPIFWGHLVGFGDALFAIS